jgi:hypothetical protein
MDTRLTFRDHQNSSKAGGRSAEVQVRNGFNPGSSESRKGKPALRLRSRLGLLQTLGHTLAHITVAPYDLTHLLNFRGTNVKDTEVPLPLGMKAV